jgi:hypothetical protein
MFRLTVFTTASSSLMMAMLVSFSEPGKTSLIAIFLLSFSAISLTIALNLDWRCHSPKSSLSTFSVKLVKGPNGEICSDTVDIFITNRMPLPIKIKKESVLVFGPFNKQKNIKFIASESAVDGEYSGGKHDVVLPPGLSMKMKMTADTSEKSNLKYEDDHLVSLRTEIEFIDRGEIKTKTLSNDLFFEVAS